MIHTYTLMTIGQQEWTILHPRKQQTYPIQAIQQWKYYNVHFHFVQYRSALCTKFELRLILNNECLLSSSEQHMMSTLVQLCLSANQFQVWVSNKSFCTTTISSQNSKLYDSQKPSSITSISKNPAEKLCNVKP